MKEREKIEKNELSEAAKRKINTKNKKNYMELRMKRNENE